MKKKIAISITASIVFFVFLISSVLAYMMSTSASVKEVNGNGNGNGTRFYGCESYQLTRVIHCDPLMNSFVSYIMPTNSSTIYTNAGTPLFVETRHGLGLQLDAPRREAVEFANTSKTNLANFSISFWLKNPKVPRPYSSLISHYDRDSGTGWTLDTSGNGTSLGQSISFSVFNAKGHRFSSPPATLSSNTFAHIVGTFDGSTIKIYENGVLIGSSGFQGRFVDETRLPIMIGSSAYCLTCNLWSGIIDDVRLYNKTINENEVREIFANDSPGTVPDGLVGHWTFNNNLNDISGHNHNGNLDSIITSLAFAPDGRLFFDLKNTGKIMIMKDDRVLPTPFATISDYYVNWEQGLLGLAVDPKFEQNHFVYLYYTAINGDNKTGQSVPYNKVVRFTENNNLATNMVVLLDKIPASEGYHSGGALAFGPDDKLYIGIGDATLHEFAQDAGTVTGKVLRINRDGSIPQDNPFPNSPVYTIGHRNIFGIAFDNKDGMGIITENGDFHYDKINIIQKGGNYGFPSAQPANLPPELFTNNSSIKPIRSYWSTIAPTQAIYYVGDKMPQLKNKFLFGTFTGNMYALTIDLHSKQLILEEKLGLRHYPIEPTIAVAQSPAGDIYYAGYHIYKLKSIDYKSKAQDEFPIEIKSGSNFVIKDLTYEYQWVAIDIHPSANMNRSSTSTLTPVQINIPRALIPRIFSVTNTITNEGNQPSVTPVDFNTTNSSSTYDTIKVRLPSGIQNSQLVINGISPKPNIQNTTNIKVIKYNFPSVSIVKFASDTSTSMPYNPSPLTVPKGTAVKWTNNDFTPHTVTEVTNKFDSGILAPNQKFKHTFDEPGVVNYYCTIHPFMTGQVIVK